MAPVAQDLVGHDACSRDGEKIGQIKDTLPFASSYLDNAPKIDTWKDLCLTSAGASAVMPSAVIRLLPWNEHRFGTQSPVRQSHPGGTS